MQVLSVVESTETSAGGKESAENAISGSSPTAASEGEIKIEKEAHRVYLEAARVSRCTAQDALVVDGRLIAGLAQPTTL